MHHIAPIRNLIRAKKMGYEKVVTMCSMCYNTLASSNNLVKNHPDKLETLNAFMDREDDYNGDVEAVSSEYDWRKLRIEVDGTVKILSTNDGITWNTLYTYVNKISGTVYLYGGDYYVDRYCELAKFRNFAID